MAAFQGMRNIIMRNPDLKIISEFWPKGIKEFGFSPMEYIDKLKEFGFKVYQINKYGINLVDNACLMKLCEGKTEKEQGVINIYCERD